VIVIRNHPDSTPAPADRFTGAVFVDELAVADPPSRVRAFSVHFTPGARSAWHRHPFGQILHVIEGVGRVQAEGDPVREIRGGDTVVTKPGEYHWHGAAPGSVMTHIAIQEADDDRVDAYWREQVDESTYVATPAD
jgi:quercetin dioxygenase-like cupin family protein